MSEEVNEPVEQPEAHDEAAGHPNGSEAASNGAAGETATPELSLEAQLEAARAEAARNLEGWQRALAEFANARKRMERQRSEAHATATVDVIKKLLPVIDDFARATESVPAAIEQDDWFTGIQMVQRKLHSILHASQIEAIAAVGQVFDPQYHEAIMQEPSDEYESGVVVRELQTGYKLGDRVIRPSLVIVAA